MFVDIEAEVDAEDDDIEDDDEDRAEDGFIADDGEQPELNDLRMYPRDDHRHRELDRQFEQEKAEDMEALAAGFRSDMEDPRGVIWEIPRWYRGVYCCPRSMIIVSGVSSVSLGKRGRSYSPS